MVALGNPVRGHIYSHTEPHPPGAYWVTATFGQIDADHLTPHQGIDIGNGTCGFDILAMEDGTVVEAFKDALSGANIARYQLTKDSSLRLGIAHMPSLEVTVGQAVKRGDVIGHCGTSGASSCHLHQGAARNGVEFDWWSLLDQGDDMLGIVTATPLEGSPRDFTVPAGATLNFYDPAKPGKAIYSASWPAGNTLQADARCKVEWPGASPLPIPNGYPFLRCISGVYAGLLLVEQYVKLSPAPPPATHSDQELQKAAQTAGYNAAVDVSAVGQKALQDAALKYPKP